MNAIAKPDSAPRAAGKRPSTRTPQLSIVRGRRVQRRSPTAKLLLLLPTLELPRLEQATADSYARQCGISVRTLFRWRARIRGLLDALRDRARSDRGNSRAIQGTTAAYVICLMGSKPRKNVSEVHRSLVRDWTQIGGEGRAPSQQTLRRFVAKVRTHG
jgi:hypothetical protein